MGGRDIAEWRSNAAWTGFRLSTAYTTYRAGLAPADDSAGSGGRDDARAHPLYAEWRLANARSVYMPMATDERPSYTAITFATFARPVAAAQRKRVDGLRGLVHPFAFGPGAEPLMPYTCMPSIAWLEPASSAPASDAERASGSSGSSGPTGVSESDEAAAVEIAIVCHYWRSAAAERKFKTSAIMSTRDVGGRDGDVEGDDIIGGTEKMEIGKSQDTKLEANKMNDAKRDGDIEHDIVDNDGFEDTIIVVDFYAKQLAKAGTVAWVEEHYNLSRLNPFDAD